MRDARRNIACPRAARLTRGGLLLTSMAQGELNRRTPINPGEGYSFFTRNWNSSELNTCPRVVRGALQVLCKPNIYF